MFYRYCRNGPFFLLLFKMMKGYFHYFFFFSLLPFHSLSSKRHLIFRSVWLRVHTVTTGNYRLPVVTVCRASLKYSSVNPSVVYASWSNYCTIRSIKVINSKTQEIGNAHFIPKDVCVIDHNVRDRLWVFNRSSCDGRNEGNLSKSARFTPVWVDEKKKKEKLLWI